MINNIIVRNCFQKALNDEKDIVKRKNIIKNKKNIFSKKYNSLEEIYDELNMVYKNMEMNEEEEKILVDEYNKIVECIYHKNDIVLDIIKNKYDSINERVIFHYIFMAIRNDIDKIKNLYVWMMIRGINK
jgi:hypothetical protein